MANQRLAGTETYALLLEAIESGTLKPGTRLREVELAESLKISRTPIRNALQRLLSQGLAVQLPRSGLALATLDYSKIFDLFQLRTHLESMATRLATLRDDDDIILSLTENLEDLSSNIDSEHIFHQLDRRFHKIICDAADNEYLTSIMDVIRIQTLLVPRIEFGRQYVEGVIEDHTAIIAEMKAANVDRAALMARGHVERELSMRIPFMVDHSMQTTDPS